MWFLVNLESTTVSVTEYEKMAETNREASIYGNLTINEQQKWYDKGKIRYVIEPRFFMDVDKKIRLTESHVPAN